MRILSNPKVKNLPLINPDFFSEKIIIGAVLYEKTAHGEMYAKRLF